MISRVLRSLGKAANAYFVCEPKNHLTVSYYVSTLKPRYSEPQYSEFSRYSEQNQAPILRIY